MKKKIAVLLIAALALTGCSDNKESGHTEGSTTESVEQTTASDSAPEPAGEESEISAAQTTAEQTTEPVPEQTQQDEPTEEPVEVNAAELISRFDNAWLGLPSEDNVYIFSDKGETKELDGVTLYGASCYDEHEGTLYFMCDYYVTGDGSAVYRWYEGNERLALCPENTVFPRLDPTSQTPQEIFKTAELLYGMFTPGKPPLLDRENTFEQDGRTYAAIADERLNTKPRLLDSLNRYFSDEIINSLMDGNSYIIEGADGTLYYDCTGFGEVPSYIGSTYELTGLTEDSAVFTVYSTWEFEAGERFETRLIYIANCVYGNWRFTAFPGCPEVWSIQSDTAQSVEDTGDIVLE
ncbi:MAG: hypothetical protein ACI4KM_11050 [Oscillospiraceae bacterium]